MTDAALARRLAALIHDVPDYPRPGVRFKDLTPLLADPAAFRAAIAELAGPWAGSGVDKVVGIEARGFLFAAPVAYRLAAGLIPVRKAGRLPRRVLEAAYALEYGEATVALHADALRPGERVLLVDDVLATGGTAAAAAGLVRRAGGVVTGCAVLLELPDLAGRAALHGVEVHSVLTG